MSRRSIVVEGLEHGDNPIPIASRVGPIVATGAIQGWDRSTRRPPDELAEEVAVAFTNLGAVIEAAGATWSDVVHVNVFAVAREARAHVNEQWVRRFPDEHSRPARHLLLRELPGGLRIQLEAIAYVEGESRG